MAAIKELIRKEAAGGISFGNYELTEKTKKSDFEYQGDLYKVKTFKEITKLERNGLFVYESVPGTAVENLLQSAAEVSFTVEGSEDAQITLELEADTEYEIYIDGVNTGKVKSNLAGKISFSVELENTADVKVKISKC